MPYGVKFCVFADEDHSKLLHFTGYINFIKDHIITFYIATSSCILLLSCLYFLLLASL